MPLRYSNGDLMGPGEFNSWQVGVAKFFPPVREALEHPEQSEAVNVALTAWVHLFAKLVRDLYNNANAVSAEEMERIMVEFQQKIFNDLLVLKWAESYQAHRDVGLEAAAGTVSGVLEEVQGRTGEVIGLRMIMNIPHIQTEASPEPKPPVKRGVFIPVIVNIPPGEIAA